MSINSKPVLNLDEIADFASPHSMDHRAPIPRIAAALPKAVRLRGADLLRRSGFAPMVDALTRHPLVAHCLAVPAAGCLALGFWASGLPGAIVGIYVVGLGLILGRDGFAALARDSGFDRPTAGSIGLSHCRCRRNTRTTPQPLAGKAPRPTVSTGSSDG